MLATAYIRTIYVPARIEIAAQYEAKLYSVAAKFSEFLRRPARLADLTTQNICDYLTAYRKSWSARATNNQRQILLSIWQDAADRPEFIPMLSATPDRKKIRKLPEEIDPPEAWNEGQAADLMGECREMRGRVGDVPACDWWLSLFDSIYWTSNRITAMLAVPSACYDGAGILVRKQKNHRPQWFPLPETCREIIERTDPGNRKLIWAHPWHPRTVWTKAREIIEAAGLPAPKTGRQLFHRLRRTTITLCAAVDQEIAQRTAGHRDYATTLKSYVDPRLVRSRSAVDVLPDPLASRNDKPLYESKAPRFRIYG
jgi:hypothetical protein